VNLIFWKVSRDRQTEIRAPRTAGRRPTAQHRQPPPQPSTGNRAPLAAIPRPRWQNRARGPALSGQKTAKKPSKTAIRAPPPTRWHTQARAMFFTNNHVKNDMDVSRETLPIY